MVSAGTAPGQQTPAPPETTPAPAQEIPAASGEPDYKLLASLVKCGDVPCLDGYKQQIGDRKIAKIVFFEKWMLLQPSKAAAEGLLRNIPDSQVEQQQMMSLADLPAGAAKSKEEAAKLAEIYQNWPISIADAAIAFPQFLPVYIRYGVLAVNDIHSDYTGNEERVCHKNPAEFVAAFERLDRKTEAMLRKRVFNPEKCRAIFVSEGDVGN